MKILVIVGMALAALAIHAVAEAAAPVFTVTWAAPTSNVDGSAIAGAITYQMYVGPPGQEAKYKTPVTSPPYVLVPTPAVGVNTCVQVTATVGGVESIKSAEVCGMVPVPQPGAPSVITVVIK